MAELETGSLQSENLLTRGPNPKARGDFSRSSWSRAMFALFAWLSRFVDHDFRRLGYTNVSYNNTMYFELSHLLVCPIVDTFSRRRCSIEVAKAETLRHILQLTSLRTQRTQRMVCCFIIVKGVLQCLTVSHLHHASQQLFNGPLYATTSPL